MGLYHHSDQPAIQFLMATAAERWPHLYNTRRYRKARKQYLVEHPLCRMCAEEGHDTMAQELDHVEQHHGDPVKFWDVSNWQGLCRLHHRSIKASMERGGKRQGCDIDGTPFHRTG